MRLDLRSSGLWLKRRRAVELGFDLIERDAKDSQVRRVRRIGEGCNHFPGEGDLTPCFRSVAPLQGGRQILEMAPQLRLRCCVGERRHQTG